MLLQGDRDPLELARLQQTPPFLQEVALNEQVSPEKLSGRGEMA